MELKDIMLGAADMGYGYAKLRVNGRTFRQPAVVGEPRRIRNEDIKKDDVRYYLSGNDQDMPKYFLGELAIRHSHVKHMSTGQDRSKAWITRVLMQAGLAATAGNASINLVTGLPVDYYFKQKADFEEMLNSFNDHEPFYINTGKGENTQIGHPTIVDHHIVPQPLGAFMNYHMNDQGELVQPDQAKKLWLVLDFGFGTMDILVMEGLEIKPGSGSPQGISISAAYRLIRDELTEQIGSTPDPYTLDQYIRKGIDYDGCNLAPLKDWAFNAIASQAQNEVDSINRRFYGCIVTGGWANEMRSRLTLPENTIVMDQLGNLQGYRKIGYRKWYRKA